MKTYCVENWEKAFPIGHDVMKFKAQNVNLPVTNFDKLAWQSSDEKKDVTEHCCPILCALSSAVRQTVARPMLYSRSLYTRMARNSKIFTFGQSPCTKTSTNSYAKLSRMWRVSATTPTASTRKC